MRFLDYPAQEPLSDAARAYHEKVVSMADGVVGQRYQYGKNPYQCLTVFRAPRPDGRVLLMFHGGGWANGYQEWMHFMSPALNKRGITLVSAGYRLVPQYLFHAQWSDCCQALAWVKAHLEITGGAPDLLFVGGHSAGAHWASLLALRETDPGQIRVSACLPVSGVYCFGEGSGLKIRPRFLGNDAVLDDQASPLCCIGSSPPPFFLAYGEHDFPHLRQQALDMTAALRRAGAVVRVMELPGCDHFSASYETGVSDGVWINAADEFMRACKEKWKSSS